MRGGAYSEYAVLSSKALVPLPDNIPPEQVWLPAFVSPWPRPAFVSPILSSITIAITMIALSSVLSGERQSAAWVVNPLTALAMIDEAKAVKAKAIAHTAAASQLGK